MVIEENVIMQEFMKRIWLIFQTINYNEGTLVRSDFCIRFVNKIKFKLDF